MAYIYLFPYLFINIIFLFIIYFFILFIYLFFFFLGGGSNGKFEWP